LAATPQHAALTEEDREWLDADLVGKEL